MIGGCTIRSIDVLLLDLIFAFIKFLCILTRTVNMYRCTIYVYTIIDSRQKTSMVMIFSQPRMCYVK